MLVKSLPLWVVTMQWTVTTVGERVEKAYAAMVYGEGETAPDAVTAVQNSYDNGTTDEFVLPTVCVEYATISPKDSVIFYNFRPGPCP